MIEEKRSLRHLNTFGLASLARHFLNVHTEEDLLHHQDAIQQTSTLILGGGSNLILPPRIDSLVLHNQIKGVEVIQYTHDTVTVEIGGGMNWHHFVLWALAQGYGGVENMALIPGTVGAAPVQNIGAYGLELKDVFIALRAYDLKEGHFRTFQATACKFAYRHSIFKDDNFKGRFFITKVQLQLSRTNHKVDTSYGAISAHLEQAKIKEPSPADIARSVIEIRRSKLPDWRQLGNAGSFFKNPIISTEQYKKLRQSMPSATIPAYPVGEEYWKLAAGWLIDQCGWKGKREGSVGCYEKQALVIVNHGGANAAEILAFSQRIATNVQEKFGIRLEREVNAIFTRPG